MRAFVSQLSGDRQKSAIETVKEKGIGIGTRYDAIRVVIISFGEEEVREGRYRLLLYFVDLLLEVPTKSFACSGTLRSAPFQPWEQAQKLGATLDI